MTKQEILEYFKDINHAYNESTRLDDLSHMLDELMQSNSDEDCISRKDLEERIKFASEMLADETTHDFKLGVSAVLLLIKSEPSIQPKPKTDVLDKIRTEVEEIEKKIWI